MRITSVNCPTLVSFLFSFLGPTQLFVCPAVRIGRFLPGAFSCTTLKQHSEGRWIREEDGSLTLFQPQFKEIKELLMFYQITKPMRVMGNKAFPCIRAFYTGCLKLILLCKFFPMFLGHVNSSAIFVLFWHIVHQTIQLHQDILGMTCGISALYTILRYLAFSGISSSH